MGDEATIRVSTADGSHTATATVVVSREPTAPIPPLLSFGATAASTNVVGGAVITVNYQFNPTDFDNKEVAWDSNNPLVAMGNGNNIQTFPVNVTTPVQLTVKTTTDPVFEATININVTPKPPTPGEHVPSSITLSLRYDYPELEDKTPANSESPRYELTVGRGVPVTIVPHILPDTPVINKDVDIFPDGNQSIDIGSDQRTIRFNNTGDYTVFVRSRANHTVSARIEVKVVPTVNVNNLTWDIITGMNTNITGNNNRTGLEANPKYLVLDNTRRTREITITLEAPKDADNKPQTPSSGELNWTYNNAATSNIIDPVRILQIEQAGDNLKVTAEVTARTKGVVALTARTIYGVAGTDADKLSKTVYIRVIQLPTGLTVPSPITLSGNTATTVNVGLLPTNADIQEGEDVKPLRINILDIPTWTNVKNEIEILDEDNVLLYPSSGVSFPFDVPRIFKIRYTGTSTLTTPVPFMTINVKDSFGDPLTVPVTANIRIN